MSAGSQGAFTAADEMLHASDPAVWSWNESWFLSWLSPTGGPAAVFRLGILPNQGRGWLWFFVHHDGEWLALEETRLTLDHFDLSAGAAYDAWGLRFGWTPTEPLSSGTFHLEGVARIRSGPRAGLLVPLAVDLAATATTPCFATGTGREPLERPEFPASRFEQSLALEGTLVIAGTETTIQSPGHRDRSWGPRRWQQPFTLGDLQGDGFQLWFAGMPQPALGAGGYIRDADGMRTIASIDGTIGYDDDHTTIAPSRLGFTDDTGQRLEIELSPLTESIQFDMAHSCDPPEHWMYWRTLVGGRIEPSGVEVRGWFEANRYHQI